MESRRQGFPSKTLGLADRFIAGDDSTTSGRSEIQIHEHVMIRHQVSQHFLMPANPTESRYAEGNDFSSRHPLMTGGIPFSAITTGWKR